MTDWVNWGQYAEQATPEVQRLAEVRNQKALADSVSIATQLTPLRALAAKQAQQGRYAGMGGVDAAVNSNVGTYSDLMKQRDRALQEQSQQAAGAAPWEIGLGGTPTESPWSKLSGRLSKEQEQFAGRSQRRREEIDEATRKAQQEAFRKQQEQQRYDAEQAAKDVYTKQYTAWSDAVNMDAQRHGGIGAGAYYDAEQGYGPKPPEQSNQGWDKMRRRLAQIQQQQIMPPSGTSSFGTNTGGF